MSERNNFQIIYSDINSSKGRHSFCESRNPDVVPVKTGNQNKTELDARLEISGMTEQWHWIPPYQVRGRLSQARNDKLDRIYVVMYRTLADWNLFGIWNSELGI